MATGSNAQAEVEFYARVDAAEVVERWIERMAAAYGDSAIGDCDFDALAALRAEAFGDGPEPPTPAAPNVVPFRPRRFDRAAHCQRIGQMGGMTTLARHGRAHFVAIGKAGYRASVKAHGVAYVNGLLVAKRWDGPRRPDLLADLAAGRVLADLDRAA